MSEQKSLIQDNLNIREHHLHELITPVGIIKPMANGLSYVTQSRAIQEEYIKSWELVQVKLGRAIKTELKRAVEKCQERANID